MRNDYVKAVGALLECPEADRSRLLTRLEGAVSAYLEDYPQASWADLTESFGTPEVCAAGLLAECDPRDVAKARRNRRRKSRVLAAVLALLAVLALCYALHMRATGGTAVITITRYADRPLEDFKSGGEGKIIYDYTDSSLEDVEKDNSSDSWVRHQYEN